jgi:hypothetical protein
MKFIQTVTFKTVRGATWMIEEIKFPSGKVRTIKHNWIDLARFRNA